VFELYLFDIRMLELTFLLDVHLIYKFNDKERLWFLQKQKKNNFLGLGPFCNKKKKKENNFDWWKTKMGLIFHEDGLI
jgi:hypothetical protein